MKNVRIVILVAGILVAGIAFNTVAQTPTYALKEKPRKEVKAYVKHKHKMKDHKHKVKPNIKAKAHKAHKAKSHKTDFD
jgi:hypothetical protein